MFNTHMESPYIAISDAAFSGTKIIIDKQSCLTTDEWDIIKQSEKDRRKGAIWIHIYEHQTIHLPEIIAMDYKFHHYDDTKKEYVYYKWNNPEMLDKVPKFATSIGGAAALILSQKQDKAFLVFEYGKFKCVTGSVECGELSVTTARREVFEETSIKLDPNFKPKVCGLWNISSARPGNINDTLICYAMCAMSEDFKLDNTEVSDGRWFDISFLMSAYDSLIVNKNWSSKDLSSNYIEYDGIKLSICAIIWLHNYVKGKTFDININDSNKINFIS